MLGLKVTDATKAELIEYFFTSNSFRGGFQKSEIKDDFVFWLSIKRQEDLMKQINAAADESQKALADYTAAYKKLSETEDTETHIKLINEARQAFYKYQAAEVKYNKLNKKFDKIIGVRRERI